MLVMQMVSTDGGDEGERYACGNMLEDERESVYCTNPEATANVNVVLRAVPPPGTTASVNEKNDENAGFVVNKIVVRQPQRRFTCPVRSGIVFIFPSEPSEADIATTKCFDNCTQNQYDAWVQTHQSSGGEAGLAGKRSVCGAEWSKELETICKWTPLPAGAGDGDVARGVCGSKWTWLPAGIRLNID
jgi:hypothetical protein